MLSALLMLRRLAAALRYARREQDFDRVAGAGVLLVAIGTLTYTLGQDWHVVDSFYFATATLTTTSVADPDLVIEDRWVKLFTVFYQLIGIGIAVEIVRRLGLAFVVVRERERAGQLDD
jgi:Ion channel